MKEPIKKFVLGGTNSDVAVTKYTVQGSFLAVALDNSDIHVVDLLSMKDLILRDSKTTIWALALDGKKLAGGSSGSEAEVRLWDLDSGYAFI